MEIDWNSSNGLFNSLFREFLIHRAIPSVHIDDIINISNIIIQLWEAILNELSGKILRLVTKEFEQFFRNSVWKLFSSTDILSSWVFGNWKLVWKPKLIVVWQGLDVFFHLCQTSAILEISGVSKLALVILEIQDLGIQGWVLEYLFLELDVLWELIIVLVLGTSQSFDQM